MTAFFYEQFPENYATIRGALVEHGDRVKAEQWQSTAQVDPMKQVIELMFAQIRYSMPPDILNAQAELAPNMPWAEEHFQERVGGEPVNPPPSHVRWPFAQGGNEKFTPAGKFSHSYPERLWAQNRWVTPQLVDNMKTTVDKASPVANLGNLVTLLRNHPTTRQAFIPIWWPIDGLMAERERVPCTIGYQFLLREGMLHCHYYMRSCDAMRHLPDDLYMATRLTQWICERLTGGTTFVQPGILEMSVTSLHIFEGDVAVIKFLESQRA